MTILTCDIDILNTDLVLNTSVSASTTLTCCCQAPFHDHNPLVKGSMSVKSVVASAGLAPCQLKGGGGGGGLFSYFPF